MRQPHGCEHVQAMHLLLTIGIFINKVAQSPETRVVDQHAQVGGVAYSRRDRSQRNIIRQVGHHDFGTHMILLADFVSDGS